MKSIKTTLLIAIGLIAATISLSFLAVADIMSIAAIEKEVFSNLENTATDNAQIIDEFLEGKANFLQTLATIDVIKSLNYSTTQKTNYLKPYVHKDCGFNSVAYIELDGKGINTLDQPIDNIEFIEIAKRGRDWDVYLWYHPEQKMNTYVFIVPVYNQVTLIGIIAAALPVKTLNDIIATTVIGKTGYVYAVDNELGICIASGNNDDWSIFTNHLVEAQKNQDLEDFAEQTEKTIRSRFSIISHYTSNGTKKLLASAQCKKIDWTTFSFVPEDEILAGARNLQFVLIIFTIVFLVLALVIAWIIASKTAFSVIHTKIAIEDLEKGDLAIPTVPTEVKEKLLKRKDELGAMVTSLHSMSIAFTDIAKNIRSGSEQISRASEEIASGNQDLSTRTEQQASALEETSAAIEEMNASIKTTGDNIQTAASLAKEAVKRAGEGAQSIDSVVASMNEISDASNKIANINDVINNIAFQTNLLALNASIEAARAGEAGKGFAVVAVEVRKLAKNSEKAAKEIESLIKQSTLKVTDGVAVAHEAGTVLKGIIETINKVSDVTAEVDAASREQITSVAQINETLTNLDENTQRNAAMVEESASATEELSAQAQELHSTIQFFKVDDDEIKQIEDFT